MPKHIVYREDARNAVLRGDANRGHDSLHRRWDHCECRDLEHGRPGTNESLYVSVSGQLDRRSRGLVAQW